MSNSQKFKVRIETERCQGHNRCHSIAPELFEVDKYGTAHVKGDGSVPEELLERARLAVKNCPENAVQLIPDTSSIKQHSPGEIKDWATDFDHSHPDWTNNPYPIWDDLRKRCPIAHSNRFEGGAYLATRYQDVRDIAYDTEHFSSRRIIVRAKKLPLSPAPPLTSDPPEHRNAKMPLLPSFNPTAVAKLEPFTRELCGRLIDGFVGNRGCDGATDYAQHIPSRVITKLMGLEEHNGDQFLHWVKMMLEDSTYDSKAAEKARHEMNDFFRGEVEKRRLTNFEGDDLICEVMKFQDANGNPLSELDAIGMMRLLLVGGIDTTWNAIGSSFWHLALHDDDRRRLVKDPSLMDTAIEELLRAYSPVSSAREVIKPVTISGCPMEVGSMVLLSFAAANRDPEVFPDANKVIIDRKENRHVAFGVGIHRCLGSNLARMELRVSIEEFLKRIPEFRLDKTKQTTWSEGLFRGPRTLPLLF